MKNQIALRKGNSIIEKCEWTLVEANDIVISDSDRQYYNTPR